MILRRSSTSIAVDLGSRHIRLVAIERKGSRPRLVAYEREPIEPETVVAGEIMDFHRLAEALRRVRERSGIRRRPAATSVSGRDVIVKRVRMDRMREAEARQIMRWEAEQHVPFDLDRVSLDFEILDPDGDGRQMEVVIVAAKKDLVESRMRLLEEGGFEPTVIDIDAFAVQTTFEHGQESARYRTFCLVNVGYEITSVSLVRDGRPLLTRDIATGERRFEEALVETLGVTMEEARQRLHDPEGPDPLARHALASAVDGFVTPIERARAYLSTSEGEARELDEVVLSGSGAALPGLRNALADRLGMPVTILDPLTGLEVDPAIRASLLDAGARASLAIPVGLGLREGG
ncbi:MAG: type IV pilus biogenesis protein PilM [Gemmatimonadota bacterium]